MDFDDDEASYDSDQAADLSCQGFVEEIHYEDVEFLEVVGRGAFGTVQKAKWQGHMVAVKTIEGEAEAKAFRDEVQQLSSVQHPNIIRLYGTCSRKPKVCLIMEYAEGGSLYNILHPHDPEATPPPYTVGHVISWALQCAKAVEYLHGMKPKPIVHRDLKPPNLCHVLCTKESDESATKHVCANYSEKCDVYSFGIVLWEMITRRRPFEDIGPPAFRIMWAVYSVSLGVPRFLYLSITLIASHDHDLHGEKRPALVRKIPKTLENLMQRCWVKEQRKRPSFTTIVAFFEKFSEFVSGGDVNLVAGQKRYPPCGQSDMSALSYDGDSYNESSVIRNPIGQGELNSGGFYADDDTFASYRERNEEPTKSEQSDSISQGSFEVQPSSRGGFTPTVELNTDLDPSFIRDNEADVMSPSVLSNNLDDPFPLHSTTKCTEQPPGSQPPLNELEIDDDNFSVEDDKGETPQDDLAPFLPRMLTVDSEDDVEVEERPQGSMGPLTIGVQGLHLDAKLIKVPNGDEPRDAQVALPLGEGRRLNPTTKSPIQPLLTMVDNRQIEEAVAEELKEPLPRPVHKSSVVGFPPKDGGDINNLGDLASSNGLVTENDLNDHSNILSTDVTSVGKKNSIVSPFKDFTVNPFLPQVAQTSPRFTTPPYDGVEFGNVMSPTMDILNPLDHTQPRKTVVTTALSPVLNPLDKDTDTRPVPQQFPVASAHPGVRMRAQSQNLNQLGSASPKPFGSPAHELPPDLSVPASISPILYTHPKSAGFSPFTAGTPILAPALESPTETLEAQPYPFVSPSAQAPSHSSFSRAPFDHSYDPELCAMHARDRRPVVGERRNVSMTPPPMRCVPATHYGTSPMSMGHFNGTSHSSFNSYRQSFAPRVSTNYQRSEAPITQDVTYSGQPHLHQHLHQHQHQHPHELSTHRTNLEVYEPELNISPPETNAPSTLFPVTVGITVTRASNTVTYVPPVCEHSRTTHRPLSGHFEGPRSLVMNTDTSPVYPLNAWQHELPMMPTTSSPFGHGIEAPLPSSHNHKFPLNNLGDDSNDDKGVQKTPTKYISGARTKSPVHNQINRLDGPVCLNSNENIDNRLVDLMHSIPNSVPPMVRPVHHINEQTNIATAAEGRVQRPSYFRSGTTPGQPRKLGREDTSTSQNVYKRVKSESDKSAFWQVLEPDLMPVKPDPNVKESLEIYENHLKLVEEYISLQEEMDYLLQRKFDLKNQLNEEEKEQSKNFEHLGEYLRLTEEKQSLLEFHGNVKLQLEKVRQQRNNLSRC